MLTRNQRYVTALIILAQSLSFYYTLRGFRNFLDSFWLALGFSILVQGSVLYALLELRYVKHKVFRTLILAVLYLILVTISISTVFMSFAGTESVLLAEQDRFHHNWAASTSALSEASSRLETDMRAAEEERTRAQVLANEEATLGQLSAKGPGFGGEWRERYREQLEAEALYTSTAEIQRATRATLGEVSDALEGFSVAVARARTGLEAAELNGQLIEFMQAQALKPELSTVARSFDINFRKPLAADGSFILPAALMEVRNADEGRAGTATIKLSISAVLETLALLLAIIRAMSQGDASDFIFRIRRNHMRIARALEGVPTAFHSRSRLEHLAQVTERKTIGAFATTIYHREIWRRAVACYRAMKDKDFDFTDVFHVYPQYGKVALKRNAPSEVGLYLLNAGWLSEETILSSQQEVLTAEGMAFAEALATLFSRPGIFLRAWVWLLYVAIPTEGGTATIRDE